MDIEKYIASGILELYVAGSLSESENLEVLHNAQQYPRIQEEIEKIEQALLQLTEASSGNLEKPAFETIIPNVQESEKVIPLKPEHKTPWGTYVGWAAALFFGVGLFWFYNQNQDLENTIQVTKQNIQILNDTVSALETSVTDTQKVLQMLRDQNTKVVDLGGQTAAPEAYAKVYWNQEKQKVIVDTQGLPEPPDGYDYQIWSLTLEPLTPTSLGVLSDVGQDGEQLFELANTNVSEAFGITLEPDGGSETPTLEQLYTLGTTAP